MSNNKFQKFVIKLFSIEDETPIYKAGRPMNDEERKIWNSPEEVSKRKQMIDDGVTIFERI